jgi:hypothetical protein
MLCHRLTRFHVADTVDEALGERYDVRVKGVSPGLTPQPLILSTESRRP